MSVIHLTNAVSSPLGLAIAILAALAIFYPVSGFLVDVCCGRFQIIIIGLTTVLFSSIIVAITVVIWANLKDSHELMVL